VGDLLRSKTTDARSGSPGGPSVCEGGGDAEMRAFVAFHGTGVQEKPSRVEVNRPFRDLHHIGGLGDSLHTPHRGKTPRNKVAVVKHFILSRLESRATQSWPLWLQWRRSVDGAPRRRSERAP